MAAEQLILKQAEEEPSNKRLGIPNLRQQSTIYRRHEARLARTYATREDPRPAVVRVLSGLPGFRLIVPPYDPSSSDAVPSSSSSKQQQSQVQGQVQQAQPRIGDYSEETVFATANTANAGTAATTTTNTITTTTTSLDNAMQPALQAMLAVGVTAGTAEMFFGKPGPTGALHNNNNPFGKTAHTVYNSPTTLVSHHQGESLAVHLFRSRTTQVVQPRQHVVSSRAMALAVSSTSVLFGAKVCLDAQQQDTNTWLSSAAAGGITGGMRVVFFHPPAPPTTPTAILLTNTIAIPKHVHLGKHVVAAMLYFSTYDCLKGGVVGDNPNRLQIAAAGACAGSLHAGILTAQQGMMRLFPTMLRAAPAHALIFSGYEFMRQDCSKRYEQ
jgi:hypothetical protein